MEPFKLEEYQQTYLSDYRLQTIYDQGWFKLFVPKVYNGLELSLTEGLKVLYEAAKIQGGLGWTVNLGAGANWFSGFLTHEAALRVVEPSHAVIAGSGFASGSWKKEEKGFKLNGLWSRCTGAKHATFFSLNAKGDNDQLKTFVIPRAQIELAEEKWPILGLRNSSSYAIDIQEQSIPEYFSFTINKVCNPHAYEIHNIPFETFARCCMTASFIGIVSCFVEHCKSHSLNARSLKLIRETIDPLLADTQAKLYERATELTNKLVDNSIDESYLFDLRSKLGDNNIALYKQVQTLFLSGGLPLVEEDKLVHWAYRDVLTAVQHYMVKP